MNFNGTVRKISRPKIMKKKKKEKPKNEKFDIKR